MFLTEPAESQAVSPARLVAEDPSVLPPRDRHSPILLHHPEASLVRVAAFGISHLPIVHPLLQFGEGPPCTLGAEVVGPTTDDRVQGTHDGSDGGSLEPPPDLPQAFLDPLHRFPAQLDLQPPTRGAGRDRVVFDREAKEVEPFAEVDELGLLLGELKVSLSQPGAKFVQALACLLLGMAEHYQIVCIPDQSRRFRFQITVSRVHDPQDLFHTVEGDVGQQRADNSTLRRTRGRLVHLPQFHVPRFEPLLDQLPCRKLTDGSQQRFMADVVKSPLDVSIHYPLACACALGKLVDPCHSIMAPSTRSKAIARSLEACFPFRLQRVFDHALPAAVKNGRNAEGPPFSV